MNHTPGPWKYDGGVMLTPENYIVKHSLLETRSAHITGTEVANSKLMSLAPEMFTALQSLCGIEAFISDTKMKELFQQTVYPVLEKLK